MRQFIFLSILFIKIQQNNLTFEIWTAIYFLPNFAELSDNSLYESNGIKIISVELFETNPLDMQV